MGKTSAIRSLAKCIGNVVLHKIVLKHTTKPEAVKHLKDEITDYTSDAFEKAQLHNWNNKEKEEIKNKAMIRVKNIIKRYPDMDYKESEINEFIDEIMEEMLL